MLTFLADFGAVTANVFDMVFFKNRPGFGAGASAATLVARARIPRPIWSGWRSIILVYIFKKKTKWQPKGTAHRTAVRNISGVAQRARCRHGVLRERIRQRRTASNIYARRPNRFSGLPNVCTSARPSRRARAIASRGCICIFMN